MLNEIVSVHNAKVKEWAALLTRKGREQSGCYMLEGVHLVQEALQVGAELQAVCISMEKSLPEELAALAASYEAQGGALYRVSEAVLAKITDAETPQPIAAVGRKASAAAAWEKLYASLVVVVDGVQDPGNLGTIIRSADAAGAAAVIVGDHTVDAYNPKSVRSAMGSLLRIPVVSAKLPELLPRAANHGVQIVVTELEAKQSCYALDYRKPTWFVLGSEAKGVSEDVRGLPDIERVIIPMRGGAESLNVAMAGTILLFEAVRQRGVHE